MSWSMFNHGDEGVGLYSSITLVTASTAYSIASYVLSKSSLRIGTLSPTLMPRRESCQEHFLVRGFHSFSDFRNLSSTLPLVCSIKCRTLKAQKICGHCHPAIQFSSDLFVTSKRHWLSSSRSCCGIALSKRVSLLISRVTNTPSFCGV